MWSGVNRRILCGAIWRSWFFVFQFKSVHLYTNVIYLFFMKMVRKYKRKTKTRDQNPLINALQAIANGMSCRAAARNFGVPESTLRRHRQNNTIEIVEVDALPMEIDSVTTKVTTSTETQRTPSTSTTPQQIPSASTALHPTRKSRYSLATNLKISKSGAPTIFSSEEEEAIEEYMLRSSDIYFGVSSIEGRELAYQYALELKKKVPSNWHEKQMAGPDWFKGYMRRHPKLSLRKPEVEPSDSE